ncbi:MAG TPA: hypothetical protein VFF68_05410, partial [Anaerolineaceae bacterium]|nr:hypothetical protein [Anaerolineaceae bacterium]
MDHTNRFSKHPVWYGLVFLTLASLISACVPNLSGLLDLNGGDQEPFPDNVVLAAEVSFLVETPVLDADEVISLEILDEVTGLALNPSRHEMKKEADTLYSLSLPFAVGSVVKYRY